MSGLSGDRERGLQTFIHPTLHSPVILILTLDIQILARHDIFTQAEIVRLEVWNTPVQPGRDAGTGAAASASWPSLVGIAWDADPRLALALQQRFPGAGLDAALAPLIVSNAHDPALQVGRVFSRACREPHAADLARRRSLHCDCLFIQPISTFEPTPDDSASHGKALCSLSAHCRSDVTCQMR